MSQKTNDFLQLNKFGDLHDGKRVFFCRTEYLNATFKKIKKLKNEVVLISGNSDVGINTRHIFDIPDNVLVWYCQNKLQHSDRLKSIPLGLENTFPNIQRRHGGSWPHAVEKLQVLDEIYNRHINRSPSGLLYGNFNEQTNIVHRGPIKQACIENRFIKWDEPSLRYHEFIDAVMDHEAVICPAGNGVDTHRIYEILYCGRIPVTIKIGDFPIYSELYEKLPIVILDSVNDLADKERLMQYIAEAKQKTVNYELLDFEYWKKLVNESSSQILYLENPISGRFFNLFSKRNRL